MLMQPFNRPLLSVTQKRIPADFLFGRALLTETCVHVLSANDEFLSPAPLLNSQFEKEDTNSMCVSELWYSNTSWVVFTVNGGFEFMSTVLILVYWVVSVDHGVVCSSVSPHPQPSGTLLLTEDEGCRLPAAPPPTPSHSLTLQADHRGTESVCRYRQ